MNLAKQNRLFTFVLYICILLGMPNLVNGQDIYFSQFQTSPLNLNPALTGVMNYQHRFSLNYRSQWGSVLGKNGFNTISASYDRRISMTRDDQIGVGGVLYGDIAGSSNFATYYGAVSGSFNKKLFGGRDRSFHLVTGANVGLGQRSIDQSNLRWPSQFDEQGNFDPTAVGGAGFITNSSSTFFDLAGGLLFFGSLNRSLYFYRKTTFYVGVSSYHLNAPIVSFLNSESKLNNRWVIHAGAEMGLSDQFSLLSSAYYMIQGPSTQLNTGVTGRILFSNRIPNYEALDFGVATRIVDNYALSPSGGFETTKGLDAIIFSMKLDYSNFAVGLSYDHNVSDLKAASNGHQAFEISLQYRIDGNLKRTIYSPRF